jgi:hypothetical protein
MGMHNSTKHLLFACVGVLVGISGAVGILFLGEVAVRTWTNIVFLGNSSNLFEANRFGTSRGNTPNIRGLSFDAAVYTDCNGFRVPSPDYQYPTTQSNKVLILGDSVAFGSGVAEEKTFVGRLRATKPDWIIFNAAVVGYSVYDYFNVVQSLIDKGHNFNFAVLILCLNDISSDSAILLDNRSAPRKFSIVERIRNITFAAEANEWLRENSKLYLYIKGIISDPSARYFYADYLNYDDNVDQKLLVVEALVYELRRVGIPLFVVISPYEYQFRARDITASKDRVVMDPWFPQRRIADFLSDKGVTTYDSAGFFLSQLTKGRQNFFLPFDAMHFSESGHMVMQMYIDNLLSSVYRPPHHSN